jgi:hypothetical protein
MIYVVHTVWPPGPNLNPVTVVHLSLILRLL